MVGASRTKKVRGILSIALATSGVVGVRILATDKWLWLAAPTHAYGLVAFVAIDIALVVGMWSKTRLATMGAILIASIQLAAMLADITIGHPTGVPSTFFRNYLLADTAYVSLLVMQGLILLLAVGALAMPLVHTHRLALLRAGRD